MMRKLLKTFILTIGTFSACLCANTADRISDTDQLMQSKNPTWLRARIKTMSVEDQLVSIKDFRDEINRYRNQTDYILPLGPKSKEKLKNISSWMYSNLVTETFDQSNLLPIIQCAISLPECYFSSHYLFDALEYQLWSYNQDLPGLDDLGYTKLFYAMAQSQYFPDQEGIDFHRHLRKIVDRARGNFQNRRLNYHKNKEIAEILTNIIISYNMMSGKVFSRIKEQFDPEGFPLDRAITTLADLLDTYADNAQRENFTNIIIPNKKNLYRALLLDFTCKLEVGSSISSCFDTRHVMPTDALRRHRKLILDLRSAINSKPAKKTKQSGFESRVRRELLNSHYKVESNVYDPNLCSEIDLVVTNIQTGEITRIESDGYFHFNQNFHGDKITSDLNGETRLKSSLFGQFGKVLRVSGACNGIEYEARIRSVLTTLSSNDFENNNRVWFIPSPKIKGSEYASCLK